MADEGHHHGDGGACQGGEARHVDWEGRPADPQVLAQEAAPEPDNEEIPRRDCVAGERPDARGSEHDAEDTQAPHRSEAAQVWQGGAVRLAAGGPPTESCSVSVAKLVHACNRGYDDTCG